MSFIRTAGWRRDELVWLVGGSRVPLWPCHVRDAGGTSQWMRHAGWSRDECAAGKARTLRHVFGI